MREIVLVYLSIGVWVSLGLLLLMIYGAIRYHEVRVTSFNRRIYSVLDFAASMILVVLFWPIALLTLRFRIEK